MGRRKRRIAMHKNEQSGRARNQAARWSYAAYIEVMNEVDQRYLWNCPICSPYAVML